MTHTGGKALTEGLIRNGIEDIFMIPGIQLDWAVEALRLQSDNIRFFTPRHEQSTTYMADGYYRATGKPGTAMVVPGPGALNAAAGLATAYASNSQVLFITPQICSAAIGKGYGLLHEIKDQSGFIQGLTKWHQMVESPQGIGSTLDAAMDALLSGRPRPVGVEIPHDFLEAEVSPDSSTSLRNTQLPSIEAPDPRALEAAANLLNKAKLPVIYAGGGVISSGASQALQALAEAMGAPVVMSDNGRGALSDRHPLAMNSLAGRAVFQHADVVLVVGSRFIDALSPTPSWPTAGLRFIHINIDADDVSPPRAPEVTLISDAHTTLEALSTLVNKRTVLSTTLAQNIKDWAQAQIDTITPQASYIKSMRNALPEDGIFVNELTQVGYLARIAFPVYTPRTYIGPGYQGTLGYGFPTALGAAVGAKDKRVLSITGDGGFGWNMQELATAARYQLPVTLVVFNDGHYGNVRAIQQRVFGAQVAVELQNPDFQLLAKAFGVPSTCGDNPQALEAAIRESLTENGPVLIEVKVSEMPSPWHLLRLQPMKGVSAPPAPASPLDSGEWL